MNKLSHYEVSLLGAKASGKANKERALERYYKNPNYCGWCKEIIHPKVENKSCVAEARKKTFCDHSCAAKYNNRHFPKKTAVTEGECEKCGTTVTYKRMKKGFYSPRRFCDPCLRIVISENTKKAAKKKGLSVLIKPIEEYSKGELREALPNYNYFGSKLASHARSVYMESNKPRSCLVCGCSYHIDVCHVKGIAEFDDGTLIGEINDLTNLVALCKNHHKEFDDKHITLEGRVA